MIGSRIRLARKEKGWSHLDLADALHGSRQTVMDWEAGRRSPPVDRLIEVAQALGKPVGWFFGEDSIGQSSDTGGQDSATGGATANRRDPQALRGRRAAPPSRGAGAEERPSSVERLLLERIDQLERREEEARERHEEMMALLLRMAERLGDAPKASRPQLLEPPGRPGRTGEGAGA